jgi:hypothetical protein
VTHRYHPRRISCRVARSRASKPRRPKPGGSEPTPTSTPYPSASSSRLFAADAPINTPIPANPSIDPNSVAMVNQIRTEIAGNQWNIATHEWTNTVYHTNASTPRYDVQLTGAYWPKKLRDVPIPANTFIPGDSDGGVVFIDPLEGCEYDMGRLVKNADGSYSAWHANALPTDSNGIYPHAEAPSASGFASNAGTITPEELEEAIATGQPIPHALRFAMHGTKPGGPVLPATGNDGTRNLVGAIPEAAHVQLNPALNLDTLGLSPYQKAIAKTLQVYGMFLVDTGGNVSLYAENSHSVEPGYVYPWGNSSYGVVPAVVANSLRVLTMGPQQPKTFQFVPNRCANIS